jgi:hypothetical protein
MFSSSSAPACPDPDAASAGSRPARARYALVCVLAFASGVILPAAQAALRGGDVPATADARSQRAARTSWQRIPPAPVKLRGYAVASVWTGRQLVVLDQPGGGGRSTAASYDPRSRGWWVLSPPATAGPYPGDRAIWTGRRIVVVNASDTVVYDPGLDRWKVLSHGHGGLVAWTGRELVAWGGGCCGDAFADGVALNPATGTRRALPRSPLAGSQHPQGAWTGRELLVFVGDRSPDTGKPWPARLARAAAYDPATRRWRRIAPPPQERRGATMTWTGRELLVVGGRVAGDLRARLRADGFAYDPATDRWRRIAPMPSGREDAAAAWTGRRLLVWGGGVGGGRESRRTLAYDPSSDRWSALAPAPIRARAGAAAFWTAHGLIVHGGWTGPNRRRLADGAILRLATP